jgi:hypothetical protein
MIQNAPIKGRHSKEEKDAERKAEEILRTPGWVVSRSTPIEGLEHLIVVLSKGLERCVHPEASPMTWCVGGSLQATLDARGPDGTTSSIRFLLCNKNDWTGDKRSKIGNSCKFHCGGLRAKNVMVGGQLRSEVFLKKCTWLKCCYGKKHYGDPPLIPWCSQCEYQKKLVKRVPGSSGMPGSPQSTLLPMPSNTSQVSMPGNIMHDMHPMVQKQSTLPEPRELRLFPAAFHAPFHAPPGRLSTVTKAAACLRFEGAEEKEFADLTVSTCPALNRVRISFPACAVYTLATATL